MTPCNSPSVCLRAITAGNVEAVRDIYAPDAVIWHNNDGIEQSADDNLRVLRWVVTNIRGLRYENVRRQRTDSGFLQQHVLRGTAPSGRELTIPACIDLHGAATAASRASRSTSTRRRSRRCCNPDDETWSNHA